MSSIQILDGGLGTSLEDKYGASFDGSTPLWSSHFLVTNQIALVACQRDFVEAGADVLLTATYQVSVEGFARTRTAAFPDGIPRHAISQYLRAAVSIAETAKAQASTKLALSLGPYGATMVVPGREYSGVYDDAHDSEEALYVWHLDRLRLFTEAEGLMDRVQYVAFETLPRRDEIRAVRRAIHDAGITTPFWISCVFPGDGDVLPDGSTVAQVLENMVSRPQGQVGARPWGIGINCTKTQKLPALVRSFEAGIMQLMSRAELDTMPVLVLYPDGTNGEVYNTVTQAWELPHGMEQSEKPRVPWEVQLGEVVLKARSRGLFRSFLVGGCCKASPADIRRLGEWIRAQARRPSIS